MAIYLLDQEFWFPDRSEFDSSGIIAEGGGMEAERLFLAYAQGIFPWYNENDPILWHSPMERMVLKPSQVHISRSMRSKVKACNFHFKVNTAFERVIRACKDTVRKGQEEGSWINEDIIKAGIELNKKGIAHSIEVWENEELIGGLYGLQIGSIFCGDSMFSIRPNASKFAFYSLARALNESGFLWIDCQVYNPYLASLGAYTVSRDYYLDELEKSNKLGPIKIKWDSLNKDLSEMLEQHG